MRTIVFFSFLLSSVGVFSQNKGLIYLYKADWSSAKDVKEASYFMYALKTSDTSYECSYYNYKGPMIRLETYKDADYNTPLGRFSWYRKDGTIDSSGFVHEGKKDGRWEYYEPDSGKLIRAEYYERGKLMEKHDYILGTTYYRDGRVKTLNKDTSASKDTVVQVEASFAGGISAWKKYLERNIETPDRFINLYPAGTRATVVISFRVMQDGSVSDAHISRSFEWSVDMEALRIINKSPKWVAATQDGKKVIFRQRQSITFVTE